MNNLNFECGKKIKDTDLGKKFELHGHVGSEFTLVSEVEEALKKYVRGYWEGVKVEDE